MTRYYAMVAWTNVYDVVLCYVANNEIASTHIHIFERRAYIGTPLEYVNQAYFTISFKISNGKFA